MVDIAGVDLVKAAEPGVGIILGRHRPLVVVAAQSQQILSLNDILILRAQHLKPNLGFDLFTIQNTNLLADGAVDPNFKNFGLAWYQTDVQADSNGNAEVAIKTILLDQIFGFDPASSLLPTHTFHVGFWFNNPEDAAACGFNPANPTPFNGEQHAGPNAMISLPNPVTNLGPLCTGARKQGSTFVCNE